MIRLTPTTRAIDESEAFQASVHAAIAESLDQKLRRELVGASEIFLEDGRPLSRVKVEAEPDAVLIEAVPEETQAVLWEDRIPRLVQEEMETLPLEKARQKAEISDPGLRGPAAEIFQGP